MRARRARNRRKRRKREPRTAGKVDEAASEGDYNALNGRLGFLDLKRRRLIDERVALEPARLEEAIAEKVAAYNHESPLPALVARRNELSRASWTKSTSRCALTSSA